MMQTLLSRAPRLAATLRAPLARGLATTNIMDTVVHDELEAIRQAGTYKKERVITSQQAASIHVTGTDQGVLNFCANNYLGLANDPALVQAAKDTLDSHGFGLSSVRYGNWLHCLPVHIVTGCTSTFALLQFHLRYSGHP